MYTGSMSADARSYAIERFRDEPSKNVILVSLKCGSLGLNLTFANRVVMMDLWWNPSVENQAIDRGMALLISSSSHGSNKDCSS